jgi:hypothetical protein
VSVQDRCMVAANVPQAYKSFSYVTWVMWNLILVHLEMMLVSVHDQCSVCAKHTICLVIVLDAPGSTPR